MPQPGRFLLSLTVGVVPDSAAAEWDTFVRRHEGWTPYQLYGWRRVIESVHGRECLYLASRGTDGGLRGVLPLVRVKSPLFGHFLVSMPYLNYGGPLGSEDGIDAVVREAVRLADAAGVDLLELRCPQKLQVDLHASHRKITVLLDLPARDPELLWTSLRAKVRSQVRRPMKEGVEVRFGPEELEAFYFVFSRHMRDLGTPVQPKRLFEAAHEQFSSEMWIACAYLSGSPVAAGCGFRWRDRFELVWASALREHNRIAPNMLLYWRLLERCIEEGVSVFDFGRCTPDSGTHRFKTQWGGRDEPLWWYQHGAGAGGGTPSPDSGPYALATKLWSRLPVGLANAIGPSIVRFIP